MPPPVPVAVTVDAPAAPAAPELAVHDVSGDLAKVPLETAVTLETSSESPDSPVELIATDRWCAGTIGTDPDEWVRVRFEHPLDLAEIRFGVTYATSGPRDVTLVMDDGRKLTFDVSKERQEYFPYIAVDVESKVRWFEVHVDRWHERRGQPFCVSVSPVANGANARTFVTMIPGVTADALAQLPHALDQMRAAIEHCDPSLATLAAAPFALSSLVRPGGPADLSLDQDQLLAECRAGGLPALDPAAARKADGKGGFAIHADDVTYQIQLQGGAWHLVSVVDRRVVDPKRLAQLPSAARNLAARLATQILPVKVTATATRSGSLSALLEGGEKVAWCTSAGATLELTFPRGVVLTGVSLAATLENRIATARVSVNGGAPVEVPSKDGDLYMAMPETVVTRVAMELASITKPTAKICFSGIAVQATNEQPSLVDGVAPEALDQLPGDLLASTTTNCDRKALAAVIRLPFKQDAASPGTDRFDHDRKTCRDAACLERQCRANELMIPVAHELEVSTFAASARGEVTMSARGIMGDAWFTYVYKDHWRLAAANSEQHGE